MLTHAWKIAFIVVPVVILGIVFGLFARPNGAETITADEKVPIGIEVSYTKKVECENKLQLEKFNQKFPEPELLIDLDRDSHLKLVYLANDGVDTCTMAEVTLAKPGYGQKIDHYRIDESSGEVVAELVPSWNGGDGSFVGLYMNPSFLVLISFVLSCMYMIAAYLVVYPK